MKAILTVIGEDKPGIIAKMSAVLFQYNLNILDVSQTVLRDSIFSMIMLVDLEGANAPFHEIKQTIVDCGTELGMEANIQKEEVFKSMHRI